MYQVGIFSNKAYSPTGKIKAESQKADFADKSVFVQSPMKQPAFTAVAQPPMIRTELSTKDEKEKYSNLLSVLNKSDKKNLEILLKNGKLLNTNSNDKSSTLDNLYKIVTVPRFDGLETSVVLKETINTLVNPFVITQQFGDIPQPFVKKVIEIGRENGFPSNLIERFKQKGSVKESEINETSIDVKHSGCCVAASIEFNLATQMPAEFARFAESLTSKQVAVEKVIQSNNLANNTLDTVWLLNAFEVPYKMDNFKEAKIRLAPDKNAILRAQIQNSNKDPLERSVIDELMQSTFMNVGSQQSYNSLTDTRKGKFNQNDKGLIEFEKTFTESIVEDKNKISVTYQQVDDNGKLIGYETDFNTVKKHILESLNMGENVIIGYTQVDDKSTIINGHEITIMGVKQDKDGKLIFICNDTDDNKSKSIEYTEDYLIPKIHHAGLPQKVVEKDVAFVDNWVEGMKAYQEAKNQHKTA